MKFRPCIDLHNGKVKQIVGSTLDTENLVENFVSNNDSAYYANLYKEDGLIGGHVIMLGSGNESEGIKALNEYKNGLQIGGGINENNALKYIENGASHVIVTSYAFEDGQIKYDNIRKIIDVIGKDKLVLDLSCRKVDNKYYIATNRWTVVSNIEVNEKLFYELANYCDEFLVHAVDVEGKGKGIDIELIQNMSKWSKSKITYAGGVSNFSDLEIIKENAKNIDVTIGSALDIFGGNLKYRDVVKWFELL